MKFFVTGGAGFIGANFIHYILSTYPDDAVLNYDILTYAGNLQNVAVWEGNARYSFEQGDIGDYDHALSVMRAWRPDVIVNFAAESHNDRGEMSPRIFFTTNVVGTVALLEAARDAHIPRFHHISTCEVFGDLALDSTEAFSEHSRYNPKTPYNASKAGSDHAVMAFFHTFGVPATISNCANNYGPYQYPEKVLPLFITNAIEDTPLPLFRSSHNKREWTHVRDHCSAVDMVVRRGTPGECYNIGSGVEKTVEEIADAVLKRLGKSDTLKSYIPDRKQHDRRYLLDSTKISAELGWHPAYDFERGMDETVAWYVAHPEWWQPIKHGETFAGYYAARYAKGDRR